VTAAVETCRSQGAHFLPGVRRLSRDCGCSQTTMTAAVARFVRAGTLVTGRRIFILPPPGAYQPPPAPPPADSAADRAYAPAARWQELAGLLRTDLTAARFTAGAVLPSVKEMCGRYATSYAPMRRALASLCADGLLVRHKRGFRTVGPQRAATGSTIVLIAMTGSLAHLIEYTPRSPEFWRAIDRECLRRNVHLVIRSCDEALQEAPGQAARTPVLGYIVWMLGFDPDRSARLSTHLQQIGLPVAVMDENAAGPMTQFTRGNPLFRVFSILTDRCAGLAVGRHLQALGHCHAACFSPLPMRADPFFSLHADGLDAVFGSRGAGMSVTYHAPEGFGSNNELINAARSAGVTGAINEVWEKIQQSLFDTYGGQAVFQTQYSQWQITTLFLQSWAEKAFDRVLAEGKATAWIGATDGMGLLALNYLKRNSVDVPRAVSVAGFDNTSQSFVAGMTSYDFNMPAMAATLLDHVLTPRRTRPRAALPPLQIPGGVIARASTGPATV